MAQGYLVSLGNRQLNGGNPIVGGPVAFDPRTALGTGTWTFSGVRSNAGATVTNASGPGDLPPRHQRRRLLCADRLYRLRPLGRQRRDHARRGAGFDRLDLGALDLKGDVEIIGGDAATGFTDHVRLLDGTLLRFTEIEDSSASRPAPASPPRAAPGSLMTYVPLLFDTHEVIDAEGAAAGNFHPGKTGLGAPGAPARKKMLALFRSLRALPASYGLAARRCLKAHEVHMIRPQPSQAA